MLIFPYRTKNPPESPPYVTITLIALNVLVYAFTIGPWLTVRQGVAENLGLSYNNFNIWRLFTSMFLHASLDHIFFNMLALWIFGVAAEGRLRTWKYLGLYLISGIAGGLAQTFIFGRSMPDEPGLGASGAIMGVMGAYLYMFPFSTVKVFWWFFIRFGVFECQAMWVIGAFMLENLVTVAMQDGTAHLAHLGGFAVGYLMAFAFKPHTDSGVHSDVKSMLSELKDVRMLTFPELQILLAAPQTDSKILMAYCQRAMMDAGDRWGTLVVEAMKQHQNLVVEDADPREVSAFLLALGPNDPNLLPLIYLRIGSRLEQIREHELACHIYRRVYDMNPMGRDAETSLYRLGRILETAYENPEAAIATYSELVRTHATGSLYHDAAAAIARLKAKQNGERFVFARGVNTGQNRMVELEDDARRLETTDNPNPTTKKDDPASDSSDKQKVSFSNGRILEI